jgi:hypothetical protein
LMVYLKRLTCYGIWLVSIRKIYINELVWWSGVRSIVYTYISSKISWIAQGKRLVFVTNNSTKSRKQYGKKFETLGLSVSEVRSCFYGWSLEFLIIIVHSVNSISLWWVTGGDFCLIFCCSCLS